MYFVLKIGIFEVKKDGNGWFAKTVILFLKYIINPSIYTNHHDNIVYTTEEVPGRRRLIKFGFDKNSVKFGIISTILSHRDFFNFYHARI